MSFEGSILVDRQALAKAQAELGAGFVRILGYFREDGIKSLGAIEDAVRKDNAAAMVIPAHTLKGEARQFGADPLATLAETIENFARQCVEHHESPRDAIADVVALRPLFMRTLTELELHASPLAVRRRGTGFGNRQG
ncbi:MULTISPECIES: Hpt domain-containing protein [Sphingomonas]|uniref:Hpt domain-containing protein n=1 Tax=Sphingomonas adhaesiva TaxID=28212 RepID=A0A2A4I6I5_9SPHN|nr:MULTISPECIES: Hpt domain-containing protein [Sphingomonas]PCG13393.1 Hpt domain-containing protein [Sphingomonas adhaesiva]PZU74974.1 MAG: Hpt domain-containing protein [Sphingomonas sp.]